MDPQVGTILEGTVTTITKFGAFVSLENRRSGLVHISEIANTFVNDVHDYLEEGQKVKVLVLSTDGGKINLSIKKAAAPGNSGAPRANAPRPAVSRGAEASPAPDANRNVPRAATIPPSKDQAFEDKLKRFLSASEGKMADLNRSMDGKRGGGRRRR